MLRGQGDFKVHVYSTAVNTKPVLQVRSGERLDPAWEEAVVMRSQGRRRDSLEEDRYTDCTLVL